MFEIAENQMNNKCIALRTVIWKITGFGRLCILNVVVTESLTRLVSVENKFGELYRCAVVFSMKYNSSDFEIYNVMLQ
jgi:hypothetical protein